MIRLTLDVVVEETPTHRDLEKVAKETSDFLVGVAFEEEQVEFTTGLTEDLRADWHEHDGDGCYFCADELRYDSRTYNWYTN